MKSRCSQYPRFWQHLRDEEQFDDDTLRVYALYLPRWLSYCDVNDIAHFKATIDDAAEYLRQLKQQEYAPSTIAKAITAARHFYGWAINREMTKHNPFGTIKLPRIASKVPRVLTPEEIARLIAAIDDRDIPGLRDRAIIEFLYSTGCRVGELTGLNLDDLELATRTAIVHGKGKKERIVFLNESTCAALLRYLKGGRPYLANKSEGAVFVGRQGARIWRQIVAELLLSAAHKAGISKHIKPHTIRHTFATHMLDQGADIRYVQELLGHEQLSTTQIYTHVAKNKLAEVYFRYHPRVATLPTTANNGY